MILNSGKTDIGQKRKTNQDAILMLPEQHFFMVADGMGGHKGGDIASQLCAQLMQDHITLHHGKKAPKDLLSESVFRVNHGIFKEAENRPELRGMGTTMNALYFHKGILHLVNVGDSRTYLVQNHKIYQMTRDNSLVNEKLTTGIYTREQAKDDPQKNVLTKTVGYDPEMVPDLYQYKVVKNDLFITCSDGLYGKVSDEDILHLIKDHIPNPSSATQEGLDELVDQLVKLANDNGGNDNISVIALIAR